MAWREPPTETERPKPPPAPPEPPKTATVRQERDEWRALAERAMKQNDEYRDLVDERGQQIGQLLTQVERLIALIEGETNAR